jgi:hypothetical protein|nr:MAG TPA_asm: hypothetical protein [Caudoviricetes sp.]
MYINSKNGRYEYRKELEKLNDSIVEFKGTFNRIEKRGCRKVALINNIYQNNDFICCHCLCDMISSVTKKIFKENIKEGQKLTFRAKVKKYTNRKSQVNYGLEIKNFKIEE